MDSCWLYLPLLTARIYSKVVPEFVSIVSELYTHTGVGKSENRQINRQIKRLREVAITLAAHVAMHIEMMHAERKL